MDIRAIELTVNGKSGYLSNGAYCNWKAAFRMFPIELSSVVCGIVLQLPILLGVPFLEKLAPPVASFLVGCTGSQLFLTDGKPNRPPLLLRMATDCDDGKFM